MENLAVGGKQQRDLMKTGVREINAIIAADMPAEPFLELPLETLGSSVSDSSLEVRIREIPLMLTARGLGRGGPAD